MCYPHSRWVSGIPAHHTRSQAPKLSKRETPRACERGPLNATACLACLRAGAPALPLRSKRCYFRLPQHSPVFQPGEWLEGEPPQNRGCPMF